MTVAAQGAEPAHSTLFPLCPTDSLTQRRQRIGSGVSSIKRTASRRRPCDAGKQTAMLKARKTGQCPSVLSPYQPRGSTKVSHRVLIQVSRLTLPQSQAAEASWVRGDIHDQTEVCMRTTRSVAIFMASDQVSQTHIATHLAPLCSERGFRLRKVV